jgi:hypothetical protein
MAARSPARSSTGPEVWRRLTPISAAMMCASVVLPSPGGPKSSTWSSVSLRRLAASMKIAKLFADLGLADVIGQALRAQGALDGVFLARFRFGEISRSSGRVV